MLTWNEERNHNQLIRNAKNMTNTENPGEKKTLKYLVNILSSI